MIAIGTFRIVVLGEGTRSRLSGPAATPIEAVSIILILRAFASGAVALTGVEAIATGVPAFKPPESRNAAATLSVMAALLGVLFIGITFLATNYGILPIDGAGAADRDQPGSGDAVYGAGTIPFLLFQAFTALLLFLAANTSFAAFPRLLAILAEDGFMPRQFSFRGDRSRSPGGSSSWRRSRPR